MASALLENLTAAAALSASDLFYVKQGGARGLKATGTQLLTLVGTTYVPLAGGTMTGALTLPAGALGTPSLMLDGAGATTGLYSTGANDISFAVNGSRRAYFSTSSFTSIGTIVGSGGLTVTNGNCGVVSASGAITWGTGGSADTYIYRDAAATLALRNLANAQTFKVYGTTDAGLTNYERLAISAQQGVGFTIGAETLGTGADNLNIVLTPAGTGSVFLGSSFSVDTSGNLTANGFYLSGNVGSWVNNRFKLKKEAVLGWSSTYSVADAYDTAFYKSVAGRIDVMDGISDTAFRDLKLRNLLNVEYHEMTEMTAPAAPAANSVRIYAEDNGSGKTRLMALFATGAAQQIAIEP